MLRTAQMNDCRPISDKNMVVGSSESGRYLEAEFILRRQLNIQSIRFALIKQQTAKARAVPSIFGKQHPNSYLLKHS